MARLGQKIKKLNVGIDTAVEFLKGEGFNIEADPNLKLTPEQEEALDKEYMRDRNIKKESDRLTQQRMERDKMQSVAIKGYRDEDLQQLGIRKKTATKAKAEPEIIVKSELQAESQSESEQQIVAVSAAESVPTDKTALAESGPQVESESKPQHPAASASEPTAEVTPTVAPAPEVASVTESAPVAESAPVDESAPAPEVAPVTESAPTTESASVTDTKTMSQKPEIFTISENAHVVQQPKIVDKIDLDALNTSTRPPKKSKEQKRKERIAKTRQEQVERQQGSNRSNNEPKKTDNKSVAAPKQQQGSTASGRTKDDNFIATKVPRLKQPKPIDKIDLDETGGRKKRKRINSKRVNISNNENRDYRPSGTASADNAGRRRKRSVHAPVVSDEDVAKQVKETLARLTERSKGKGAKYRKDKREAAFERMQEEQAQARAESKVLKLTEFVTANELAVMMNRPVTDIIKTCMNVGIFVSINQRMDAETIKLVAEEYGFKTEFVSADVVHAIEEEPDDAQDLVSRPPIITVMGHVDHGKTSLLDYIRKSNVIAGEAGGITQHIGAYNVTLEDGRHITFLDTPGHEAFTAMRARGAQITDIAIIIVAADDDVMPQTIEAINHASAAGVPIVFAINKIDKPGANPEKVKESLAKMNYMVEEWGGKYQSQDISAKKGINIKELLEKVLLEAELLELKANPNRKAVGSIIESSLDKGRGYVATLLVQNGTLHVGDVVLAGTCYGRVKAMFNERNQRIQKAGPSEPVIILGLNGAPAAGDKFNVFVDEHEARSIANIREQLQREQGLRTSRHLTLDEIGRRIAMGNFQEMNIIVKGDVDGSVEALSDALIKLSTPSFQVNVIHKAVGQISESDIMLAAASNAIVVGFQVRPSMAARKLAEQEEIDIRLYSVIYDAIEEIKAAMEGMLSPKIKEEVTATLEILQIFKISKVGTVAGCIVKDGKIKRTNKVRLIRDGIVVFSGELASLKRLKDDVKEVPIGMECGLNIDKYNDLKVGDMIEAYEEVEMKQTL